jgi:septal ring factor EnvC (AmiA/AmiB activator)
MTIEIRDLITAASVLVALFGMLLVNRNAKRALRPAAENTDLTRIRDLRAERAEIKQELTETRQELELVRNQVHRLSMQVEEASNAATQAYRDRQEMIRFAQMPGVTIDDWLRHFDRPPPETPAAVDRG